MITVSDVINCTKTIEKKRRPEFQIVQRHYKMNIDLVCKDLDLKMVMFIRRLIESPTTDFTIGLRIDGPSFFSDYTVVMVRFQGPHGGQSASKQIRDLHNNYHVHLYTEDDRMHHRKLASYKEAGTFNSFEQAIMEFLDYCNIDDPNGIFDNEVSAAQQFAMNLDNL